jgi:hypothetical protein
VITQENIDEYSFQLTESDRVKIDLNAKEITGVDLAIRTN